MAQRMAVAITIPSICPETLLRQTFYFPPFQAALKAGVGTFMSAYMDLNNVPDKRQPMAASSTFCEMEWGFEGFVVSDAFAVANLVTQGFAI